MFDLERLKIKQKILREVESILSKDDNLRFYNFNIDHVYMNKRFYQAKFKLEEVFDSTKLKFSKRLSKSYMISLEDAVSRISLSIRENENEEAFEHINKISFKEIKEKLKINKARMKYYLRGRSFYEAFINPGSFVYQELKLGRVYAYYNKIIINLLVSVKFEYVIWTWKDFMNLKS